MLLTALEEVLSGPCRRHPVRSLRVFGSVARAEAKPGSDLDLIVEFEDMPPAEYASHYFELLHELQDAVGTEVDLLTPGSVTRPSLKRNIQEENVSRIKQAPVPQWRRRAANNRRAAPHG